LTTLPDSGHKMNAFWNVQHGSLDYTC